MRTIAFIVPYFGKFNNYFSYWLLSCEKNATVDWFLISDCKLDCQVPANVHVVPMNFNECRTRVQSCFDFPISLEKPYKLCDFKVAYGYIFRDLVKDFDFWGYCDVDLIWGDIRSFFNEVFLDKCEKFSHLGHCSIYRNNNEMNTLFMGVYPGIPSYKEVFSSPLSYVFDEKIMKYICRKREINVVERNDFFFDCSCRYYRMRPSFYQHQTFDLKGCFLFEWIDGRLILWSSVNHSCRTVPLMYAHFQKRHLKISAHSDNHFFICDSNICESTQEITAEFIVKNSPNKLIYWPYVNSLFNRFLSKCFKKGKVNFYSFSKEQNDLIEG